MLPTLFLQIQNLSGLEDGHAMDPALKAKK
jgi:hypothetical protein